MTLRSTIIPALGWAVEMSQKKSSKTFPLPFVIKVIFTPNLGSFMKKRESKTFNVNQRRTGGGRRKTLK
jgi:hypothetical protein